MKVTRNDVYEALATPAHPVRLFSTPDTDPEAGWAGAKDHASRACDRVVTGTLRLATPFVGAAAVTKRALALPGWKKAAVVPAPVIGLAGGTLLGAGNFICDFGSVLLHGGGATAHVLYAVGHGGFAALYEDAKGVWRAAENYVNEPERASAPSADAQGAQP